MVFAAHFYLQGLSAETILEREKWFHTAVRTRQSSAVRYRNALVSSFIFTRAILTRVVRKLKVD